jgi:CheY-specific phosphatase CheX
MESTDAWSQILESFATATRDTLSAMAQIDVVQQPFTETHFAETSAIAVHLPLRGTLSGMLVLRVPSRTASALAVRILGDIATGPTLDDTLIRDCIGEVANVVGGQTKALHGDGIFRIDLSQLTITSNDLTPTHSNEAFAFTCELGDFSIHVLRD